MKYEVFVVKMGKHGSLLADFKQTVEITVQYKGYLLGNCSTKSEQTLFTCLLKKHCYPVTHIYPNHSIHCFKNPMFFLSLTMHMIKQTSSNSTVYGEQTKTKTMLKSLLIIIIKIHFKTNPTILTP